MEIQTQIQTREYMMQKQNNTFMNTKYTTVFQSEYEKLIGCF